MKEALYIIFLISHCYGRAQTIVGSDIPGNVVLGYIRKQAKQEWEKSSKQHPSMVYVSAYIYLAWVLILMSFDDEWWYESVVK